MAIRFSKPRLQGEVRIVKNGILIYNKKDWEIILRCDEWQ